MRWWFIFFLVVIFSSLHASDGTLKFEKQKFSVAGIRTIPVYPAQNDLTQDVTVKSKKKALLLSLLVPGVGELYLNNWQLREWQSGKYFFASEALLWAGHFYFQSYSHWSRSDAEALAAAHANVNWKTSKPSGYFSVIGKFTDIYAFNDIQRRFFGPEAVYEENTANFWQWDNETNQNRFEDKRLESRNYKRYSQFVVYGVVVNHVLSAINAVRMYNKRQKLSGYNFRIESIPSIGMNSYYIGASMTKSF
ncbi:hypothetical protein K1X84_04090 [bacterium]|nr:hypothetical protein [bacterium]